MPAPRASSKPVPLIKRFRTPVKRRKRKQVSLDEPKRIDVDPASPSFAGRLVSEINAAPGPKSLAKLVRDFGPLLDAQHLSMALGRLAGYYTGTDSAQPDRQLYRCGRGGGVGQRTIQGACSGLRRSIQKLSSGIRVWPCRSAAAPGRSTR